MNLLEYYGFLTRKEYETYCFAIRSEIYDTEIILGETVKRHRLAVQSVSARDKYPKTVYEAKRELTRRGLDAGDENGGLARVIESGEVCPAGNMWKKGDIELAMISLAERGCIEPWVYTCRSFNIRPVEYVKALRTAAEENLEKLAFHGAELIYYRFEFHFGNSYAEPGKLSITLREDWKKIRQSMIGRTDDAPEE